MSDKTSEEFKSRVRIALYSGALGALLGAVATRGFDNLMQLEMQAAREITTAAQPSLPASAPSDDCTGWWRICHLFPQQKP